MSRLGDSQSRTFSHSAAYLLQSVCLPRPRSSWHLQTQRPKCKEPEQCAQHAAHNWRNPKANLLKRLVPNNPSDNSSWYPPSRSGLRQSWCVPGETLRQPFEARDCLGCGVRFRPRHHRQLYHDRKCRQASDNRRNPGGEAAAGSDDRREAPPARPEGPF
jgi:hypothetical protein